ncbi:MAG: hypothetical protein JKY53_12870 [Flavobacteriales bacterium]|nr:hypothetical protein [Flavobacteriales bacterium]
MIKVKAIMLSAVMLLGMGLVAVPQAMAGGSGLENWRLPWGLEFGKPISAKLKRIGSFNKRRNQLTLAGDVRLKVKEGALIKVGFIEKVPKAFRRLGLVIDKGKVDAIGIVRRQGGKITDISKEYGDFNVTFASSPYSFFFNMGMGEGKLNSLWVSEKLEDF